MVRGRLGCRIGAVGRIGRGFAERGVRRVEGSVHLVGGDMQEAETPLILGRQSVPVPSRLLQKTEGADHIGLNKVVRCGNGAVHMALGGEIDNHRWTMGVQQLPHLSLIADIALDVNMARMVCQGR